MAELVFSRQLFIPSGILFKKNQHNKTKTKPTTFGLCKIKFSKMIQNLVFLAQPVIINNSQSRHMQGGRGALPAPSPGRASQQLPPASDTFASEAFCSIKIKLPSPQLVFGLKSCAIVVTLPVCVVAQEFWSG